MKPLRPTAAQRSIAWSLAALVFALSLLAASPVLHAWMHRQLCAGHGTAAMRETTGGKPHPFAIRVNGAAAPAPKPVEAPACPARDEGCAVTLFAAGAEPLATLERLAAPVRSGDVERLRFPEEISSELPSELLPPAVGPPGI